MSPPQLLAALSLPAPWALRLAQAEDQAFLDALFLSARPDLQALQASLPGAAALIDLQHRAQAAGLAQRYPRAQQALLTREQNPVGQVILQADDRDLRVVDLAIAPAAQRQGAARTLLLAVLAHAQAQGLRVGLAVGLGNQAARQLYTRLGFVVLSQDPLFAQMVWPSPAD